VFCFPVFFLILCLCSFMSRFLLKIFSTHKILSFSPFSDIFLISWCASVWVFLSFLSPHFSLNLVTQSLYQKSERLHLSVKSATYTQKILFILLTLRICSRDFTLFPDPIIFIRTGFIQKLRTLYVSICVEAPEPGPKQQGGAASFLLLGP
jgi:hypothetical protein